MIAPLKNLTSFARFGDYYLSAGPVATLKVLLAEARAGVKQQIADKGQLQLYNEQLHLLELLGRNELKTYLPSNVAYIYELADFPVPIAGVINLDPATNYQIMTLVDIGANRLVSAGDLVLNGQSDEKTGISSTTTGALITATGDCCIWRLNLVAASASKIFDLADSDGSHSLIIYYCSLNSAVPAGTIAGYNDCRLENMYLDGAGAFTFTGVFANSITVSNCHFFSIAAAATAIVLDASITVSNNISIHNTFFNIGTGRTAISVADPADIANSESFLIRGCIFRGAGTYITGITQNSDKTLWKINQNLRDTYPVGMWYMQANATATVIAGTGTAVKMAGTTTLGALVERFTMPANNRLRYDGAITRRFRVVLTAAANSANGNELSAYLYRGTGAGTAAAVAGAENRQTASGAGRAESINLQWILEMATTDYIEVWVANQTAVQNITVESAILTIQEL